MSDEQAKTEKVEGAHALASSRAGGQYVDVTSNEDASGGAGTQSPTADNPAVQRDALAGQGPAGAAAGVSEGQVPGEAAQAALADVGGPSHDVRPPGGAPESGAGADTGDWSEGTPVSDGEAEG